MLATDADVPDHDPAMISALVRVLGADRLVVLTDQLGSQIAALGGSEKADLAQALHRLRGAAASLGLPRLAAAIAAIDPGVSEADELADRLSALLDTYSCGKAAAIIAASHDGATKR